MVVTLSWVWKLIIVLTNFYLTMRYIFLQTSSSHNSSSPISLNFFYFPLLPLSIIFIHFLLPYRPDQTLQDWETGRWTRPGGALWCCWGAGCSRGCRGRAPRRIREGCLLVTCLERRYPMPIYGRLSPNFGLSLMLAGPIFLFWDFELHLYVTIITVTLHWLNVNEELVEA